MKNTNEPPVILVQGDNEGNVISETNVTYALETGGPFIVARTALFEKRLNGNTLIIISLTGTIVGEFFPASINLSSIATIGGGPVVKVLNNFNETTGKSYTNIRRLDNGMVLSYGNLLVYDVI